MELSWVLVGIYITLLVLFVYTNGFHDTANMVATVVACRAMTPAQAILLVSVFAFLGPLLGGTEVSNTVGGWSPSHTVNAYTGVFGECASIDNLI
ncbi:MAG: inorganic phosphate transporter [Gammaproteobacteria bacterium]|jgi:PiT family inorganic phosphate transporter